MARERQYFYQVDPDGRLFHDGTELTDQPFLDFFFSRIRPNRSEHHREFPFLSPCGREMNYLACTDTPIVFRRLIPPQKDGDSFALLFAGSLRESFNPANLRYEKNGGQLWHPVTGLQCGESIPGRLGRHALEDVSRFISGSDGFFSLHWDGQVLSIPLLNPAAPIFQ